MTSRTGTNSAPLGQRLKALLRRFSDWLAVRVGNPTSQDRQAFFARWDYAQANALALWESDPFKDELAVADALTASDPVRFKRLLDLAERGSVWSMDQVARCYTHGQGVGLDKAKAWKWSRRAFERGSLEGLLAHGAHLALEGDFDKSEAVFQSGADRGWGPAIYWLAWCRLKQSRTSTVYWQVLPLLEKSAALGSPVAEYALSYYLARGRYGLTRIPSGFRRWWNLSDRVIADFEERKQASKAKDRRRLWEM